MVPQVQIRTVVVDVGRCLGCRSCELACAKAHAGLDDIVEAILSDAPLKPRVRVVEVDGRLVPVQCRHCEDPPCVAVCP
ncbi:MAG: 4Fe-4S dicluster domain-containing protein, partial [Candidatus Brocadiae bacterium]|nr:4Fe-4S dicluster domain-containing protein [Candidatus Brocadiia bacterium]